MFLVSTEMVYNVTNKNIYFTSYKIIFFSCVFYLSRIKQKLHNNK